MTCSPLSRLSTAVVLVTIALVVLSQAALAVPLEPVPSPDWRALRPDHVRTWYIFSDLNNQHGQVNGILDPGDKLITRFDNWWSPVSAHTQHNYEDGPYGPYNFFYRSPNPNDDMPSGPMNFASSTTPGAENYWLPREKNAVQFYMTYSQYDNNDWATFSDAMTGDAKTIVQQRNLERNAWALGCATQRRQMLLSVRCCCRKVARTDWEALCPASRSALLAGLAPRVGRR